ncbi:MAG: flagellin [Chloroflexota bacterium]
MAVADFTRINTNIGAFNALNSLKNVQQQLGVHQLRLSTGKRINEAADDPAGLTIAIKMQSRASGLGVALDNIGDAKNMLSVAEGGLQKVNDILMKMRDKAEQAASDTLGTSERSAIAEQISQFVSEIDDIVNSTKWNGNKLLDGLAAFSSTVTFQTGPDNEASSKITLTGASFGAVSSAGLTVNALTVNTAANASTSMATVDTAVSAVAGRLQTLGALVARLNFREETVTTAKVNTEAAYSRIMNADMAYEQLEATKMQILQQTATAMLSQANSMPQNVLSLFR